MEQIEQISLDFARAKGDRVGEGEAYACPFCQDRGFILLPDGRAKKCSCYGEKISQKILKKSHVNYEEIRQKSLASFRPDTELAENMLEMAKDFLADKNARGIGFFGQSGTGKTHICLGVAQELVQRTLRPFLYFNFRADIQKLKSIYYAESYYTEINKYIACPILYIDDLFKLSIGRDGQLDRQDLQIVFDIINSRYLNRRYVTIISSELTVRQINQQDEALGSRIFDMIHPYGMECKGKNRRLDHV